MPIEQRAQQRRLHRKVEGIAACLLPFEEDGTMAQSAFEQSVARTDEAGLQCAVNMDTGYANHLTAEERREVLGWTQRTLEAGRPFVAGVFVEGLEGALIDLYRKGADEIVEHGGTPILFQTTRFHDWEAPQIVDLYAEICGAYPEVLGFELGQMFAPNGMIFSDEVIKGLMSIPSLKGIKHSSLSREEELRRLALRDAIRPDFRIYTGNDLGIDMIEYGSDYLLGLAAFCPEKFAERDRYWESGDDRYFALHDALQYLGNVAFRHPVPAYKHSCAMVQNLLDRIPSSRTHPDAICRPDYEEDVLRDCLKRLGYSL